MTDPNRSHISLIVDRTGSMQTIRTDAEGAVNAFIKDQQKEDLPCSILLADFDDHEPFRMVYDGELKGCPDYTLVPRGSTPLLDAIGKGISLTGERLAAKPEAERPGKVFFVIQTDGQENSSKEWTLEKVVEAIKRQESVFAWTFIFLGAGKDAWASSQMFKGTNMFANVVRGGVTGQSVAATYSVTSSNLRAARAGAQGVNYAVVVDDEGKVTPEPPKQA